MKFTLTSFTQNLMNSVGSVNSVGSTRTARFDKNEPRKKWLERRPNSKTPTLIMNKILILLTLKGMIKKW